MNVEKTTVYLPEQLQRELRDAARREGRPQAELVRDALKVYLGGKTRPRPRSIGMVDDPELRAVDAKRWVHEQWGRAGESR